MTIPEQVQKQLDESNEIHSQMFGKPETPNPNAPARPNGDSPNPGEPNPAPTPAAEQATPNNENGEPANWEQRYNVLKGKYDNEVPRMASTIRELQKRLQTAESESSQLHAQLQTTNQEVQALRSTVEAQKQQAARQQKLAELGDAADPDLVDLVGKVVEASVPESAAPETAAQPAPSTDSPAPGQPQEMSEDQKSRQMMHMEALIAAEGFDMDAIDKHAQFDAWLKEHDPLLNSTRSVAMNNAFFSGDPVTAANFYIQWAVQHKELLQGKPATALDEHIQPDPTNAPPPAGGDVQGRMIPESEITAFYDSMKPGKVSNLTAEEFQQRELEYLAAGKEGRILYGQ